jgi:hypothetical protein
VSEREKDTTAPTLITLWDCCVCVFLRSMPPQRCAVSVRGLSSRSAGARVLPSTPTTYEVTITTPTAYEVTTTAPKTATTPTAVVAALAS